ncbi:wax ester/triacylglycerol synthase domain-containing protein [Streptomyces sp. 8N616]|uniref:wax ester/triacylglycerol synthase domain-containing protein n=1 Tax=Streptomyces sp. 8N616 TaxID=3457414 RepID=UPI003FCF285B
MGPVDAWLYRHQTEGAICMTFGLLAWFDGPPPLLPELRKRVRERWCSLPRLRALPVDGPWPHWTLAPQDPDPDHHVVAGPHAEPGLHVQAPFTAASEAAAPQARGPVHAGVEACAAALLAEPLGSASGLPPWRLHLLPAEEGSGFALLLRAHHALLDGRSLITLLRTLLDGPGSYPLPPAAAHLPEPLDLPSAPRSAQLRAAAGLLPAGRRLPFHARVDEGRALAWSELPVHALRQARGALPGDEPASANSVFLAAAAAALRATGTLGARPGLPGVCAMVPVDLRSPRDEAYLGNHYATIRIPLPTAAAASGPDRLTAVERSARRAAYRRLADAQALLVSRTPPRRSALRDALARYADSPRYSSLLCTNVRTGGAGGLGALALGPATATRMALVPALSPGHPLALSLTTYGTTTAVAVLTDEAHAPLGRPLADRIRHEVLALRSAALDSPYG